MQQLTNTDKEWIKVPTEYWMKLWSDKNRIVYRKYMFHKNKRIQKKRDKRYKPVNKIIKWNFMPLIWAITA